MIVQRATWKAKPGHVEDLIALLKSESSKEGMSYRVYTTLSGSHETMVVEWEFESLAAQEAFWAKRSAKPETPSFMVKWRELTENEGSTEFLTLE